VVYLISSGRIEKYQVAFQRFEENWIRKNLILFFLRVGKVNKEISTFVKSNLPAEAV